MERSIERIWKEGFLREDQLRVDQVVDLYNLKSIHLVDRMHRMFKGNAVFVVVLLVLHALIMGLMFRLALHAAVMSLIFVPLIIYGRKQLRLSRDINKNDDSYHFLRSFYSWLKSSIAGYTRIFRWFYPIYVLTLGTALWMAPSGGHVWEKLISKLPSVFLMVGGVPIYWALGLVVVATLSAIYAPKIYEWDLKTIYGGVFERLDEMLEDMKELRGEER